MKIGAENRRKLAIAAVLMAIGVFLFIRMVRGWESTPSVNAAPAPSALEQATAQPPAPPPKGRAKPASAPPTLDPRLRVNLLAQSEDVKDEGSGRNIFSPSSEEIPNPISNGRKPKPGPQPAPAPVVPPSPPPTPIPLKFFGFASTAGEPKKVFLSQDNDVFIAGEGELVNRRYKVIKINAMSVEIEDVLRSYRQMIPLTQG